MVIMIRISIYPLLLIILVLLGHTIWNSSKYRNFTENDARGGNWENATKMRTNAKYQIHDSARGYTKKEKFPRGICYWDAKL